MEMENQMKNVLKGTPVAILMLSLSLFAQDAAPAPVSTASGNTSQQGSHFTNAPTFSERYPRYKLSASDSFDVVFDYTPEWNQTLTVQPDGYVTARSIGDVYVNGLTPQQLKDKLEESYGKILN